jgi:hypothetical protein
MPPKVEEASAKVTETVFVFEKDRMLKKFNEENYVLRQKIMEEGSKHVPVRPIKNPEEKLKERLNTYHNVHKMRTDYKNYVRWYGKPSFDVPDLIVC